MSREIHVYSKKGCPFCSLLKLELANRSIRFVEIDLSDDDVRKTFYSQHNVNTVPQLFIVEKNEDGEPNKMVNIGGYEDCAAQWKSLENIDS